MIQPSFSLSSCTVSLVRSVGYSCVLQMMQGTDALSIAQPDDPACHPEQETDDPGYISFGSVIAPLIPMANAYAVSFC